MDNLFYLIHIHSNGIEGICITKKNNNFIITKDVFDFFESNNSDLLDKNLLETELWIEKLENFLDQQNWRNHPICFILPAENVTFRKIIFPFQERKKVEQALPFELEEDLIFKLSDSKYSMQVNPMSEQNSEALVLLMESKYLKQLKKICYERDLLIRNVDCAAYALFRSKIFQNFSLNESKDLFQIYVGGDESFVNTIREGRLDEIKIFPNLIPEILHKHTTKTKTSLSSFLKNFSKFSDKKNEKVCDSKNIESYLQIKEELQRLCSQFTLHLRIKNFNSESQIETHGIFGPIIKWDGLVFRKRTFPLPEAQAFAERSEKNLTSTDRTQIESKEKNKDFPTNYDKTPDTLQELMAQAKTREKTNEIAQKDLRKSNINKSDEIFDDFASENNLESVNPQSSLLSLIERKFWGILGDLIRNAEIFLEPHKLSLFHESTPWRIFFRRNKVTFTITTSFLIIISVGLIWQAIARLNFLKEEVFKAENIVQYEIRKVIPESTSKGVKEVVLELREKIKNRKNAIKTSKKFEKREYRNLLFLKNVSILLDEDAPFQVDSMEYAPDRFSMSGMIDSYDRLQILKKKLKELDDFKGKRILESNRKSPDGIVYKISIELK